MQHTSLRKPGNYDVTLNLTDNIGDFNYTKVSVVRERTETP